MNITGRGRILRHNEQLDCQMRQAGHRFVRTDRYEHYVDQAGNYVPYPDRYIRGPFFADNGSPRPWSYMIHGPGGWLYYTGRTVEGARLQVLEKLTEWGDE